MAIIMGTTTRVRHRIFTEPRISDVRVSADRVLYEVVNPPTGQQWLGTEAELRDVGFTFGDEELYTCAREWSDFTTEHIAENVAEAEARWLTDADRQSLLLVSAVKRITKLTDQLAAAHRRGEDVRMELSRFRTEVREVTIAAMSEHDLCVQGTNAFLEGLGLEPVAYTFRVRARRDGKEVLSVSDVVAKDEETAVTHVQKTFTAAPKALQITTRGEDTDEIAEEGDDRLSIEGDDLPGFSMEEFMNWYVDELDWSAIQQ